MAWLGSVHGRPDPLSVTAKPLEWGMRSERGPILLGLASIVLWSTTVGASRLVMERWGLFPGAAIVLLAAGGLLLLATTVRYHGISWVRRLSIPHLARAGPLFVLYMFLMYSAVGVASSRLESIVAGLANYIWPATILVLSSILLKRRAHGFVLATGVTLALGGIVVATSVNAGGMRSLLGALGHPTPSLILGLLAGATWGLYSVIIRIFPQSVPGGAVGLFLLVAGAGTAVMGWDQWGAVHADAQAILLAAYMAVFPTSLAYWLWDLAIKSGDVPSLGAWSNLIPVFSATFAVAVLDVPWRWELLLGAVLVSGGALLARSAFPGHGGEMPLTSDGLRSDPPPRRTGDL